MNKKIRDVIFWCICFSIPFVDIPNFASMYFIGGQVGNKLVFFPLVLGVGYSLYCQWKYKNVLINFSEFSKFYILYFSVILLSLLIGLIYYPYWDHILSEPINQIEKLSKVKSFLQSYDIDVDVKILTSAWIIFRQIKDILAEAFLCFGGSYIIYCWYRDELENGFRILINAALFSLGVIFAYGCIELLYLMHNQDAATLLVNINPFIHEIKSDGRWWPPLLWEGQLRSVFAEPSYFGIYSAFVMPFLWYKLINKRSMLYVIFTFVMTFFLFLTKARTGFMLHIGQLFLLIFVTLFFLREIRYLKNITLVMICSLIAFICSNFFITNYMDVNKNISNVQITNEENQIQINKMTKNTSSLNEAMTEYINNNMTSLTNPDKRSNRARYSIMVADIKIGLEHPFFGVGMGLRNGYIPKYLSEEGKNNYEVKMWLAFKEKFGIMRSVFPKLGEYTSRFGETGIVGLAIFLFPPLFLLCNLVKKIKSDRTNELKNISFMVSLLGIMVSGIGDTLNVTYCYWLLLGLGYAMYFQDSGILENSNERT